MPQRKALATNGQRERQCLPVEQLKLPAGEVARHHDKHQCAKQAQQTDDSLRLAAEGGALKGFGSDCLLTYA